MKAVNFSQKTRKRLRIFSAFQLIDNQGVIVFYYVQFVKVSSRPIIKPHL